MLNRDVTMEQVERLAREICKGDGRDPDEIVPVGSNDLTVTGRQADEPIGDVPQWRIYEPQARRFIAAQNAL